MLKKRWWCLYLWGLAGILLMTGCEDAKNDGSEQTHEDLAQTEVRVAEVEIGSIAETISVTGSVFALHESRIYPKVAGRIEHIPVEEGERIVENQVLVRLEQQDFVLAQRRAEAALGTAKAALQQLRAGARGEDIRGAEATLFQAQASLEEARSDFERVSKLHEESVASRQMFDSAKARYEVARQAVRIASEQLKKSKSGPTAEDLRVAEAGVHEAEVGLEIAEQQLKDSTILAPFSGIVAEKLMNEGEMVSAVSAMAILRLVDTASVKIQAMLPEKELSRVRVGLEAFVEVEAYRGEQFPGQIRQISPVVDPVSRSFKLTIEIANPDSRLKPGMFARVKILSEQHDNTLLIPRPALSARNDETLIFVVENGEAEQRHVTIGLRTETELEILEGVQAGELVIIEGNYGLDHGERVKVVE